MRRVSRASGPSCGGFTLVELIVALSANAIVVASIFLFLRAYSQAASNAQFSSDLTSYSQTCVYSVMGQLRRCQGFVGCSNGALEVISSQGDTIGVRLEDGALRVGSTPVQAPKGTIVFSSFSAYRENLGPGTDEAAVALIRLDFVFTSCRDVRKNYALSEYLSLPRWRD